MRVNRAADAMRLQSVAQFTRIIMQACVYNIEHNLPLSSAFINYEFSLFNVEAVDWLCLNLFELSSQFGIIIWTQATLVLKPEWYLSDIRPPLVWT